MNKGAGEFEPLCATSERGETPFSGDELQRIKSDIGRRIVEAFDYHPDSEIAFLLKTNIATVKSFTEGSELPETEILLRVYRATDVSIHWILTGEGGRRANSVEVFSAPKDLALAPA